MFKLKQINDRLLSWLGTGTSIKWVGVILLDSYSYLKIEK
jgi:hypothetical protein